MPVSSVKYWITQRMTSRFRNTLSSSVIVCTTRSRGKDSGFAFIATPGCIVTSASIWKMPMNRWRSDKEILKLVPLQPANPHLLGFRRGVRDLLNSILINLRRPKLKGELQYLAETPDGHRYPVAFLISVEYVTPVVAADGGPAD